MMPFPVDSVDRQDVHGVMHAVLFVCREATPNPAPDRVGLATSWARRSPLHAFDTSGLVGHIGVGGAFTFSGFVGDGELELTRAAATPEAPIEGRFDAVLYQRRAPTPTTRGNRSAPTPGRSRPCSALGVLGMIGMAPNLPHLGPEDLERSLCHAGLCRTLDHARRER
jgi:hypothetical protein